MAAIHDYECKACLRLHLDRLEAPEKCEECGSDKIEKTFKGWFGHVRAGFLNGGRPVNERVNPRTGEMQYHGAVDDPLTQIELGLRDRAGDSSISTFTPEQRAEYMGKYLTDGDSKRLREDMLTQRSRNLSEARETVKRATQ